jgi:uncharacterized membrane protein
MTDNPNDPRPNEPETKEEKIDAAFRNGSLTAISVLIGFSLSFLTRWAGIPGTWHVSDFVALVAIILGIVLQITSLASLLLVRSLLLRNYNNATRMFLTGLALAAAGVVLAIGGDIAGYGQRLLRG